MSGNPISCDGLKGTAQYVCQLETQTTPQKTEEEIWSCVKDEFVKKGGSEGELFNLANVGYYTDPTGYRQFVNDAKELEGQEKFQFAYSNPDYYHCIAKSDLPIPFAMNDFKKSTSLDDKIRSEENQAMDTIKANLEKESEKYPPGSKERIYEHSKRIYNRAEKELKFYGDCEIECADYEALKYKQGLCSESSAVMYYDNKYSNLNPEFYYFHDMEPSLDWIELFSKLGAAQDHVFINIPLDGKNATNKSDNLLDKLSKILQQDSLHIDLINARFNARYKFGIKITEKDYATLWLLNKVSDLLSYGRMDEAEEALKKAFLLSPHNISITTMLISLYTYQNRKDDRRYISGYLERNFKNHPLGPILSLMSEMQMSDIDSIDEKKMKETLQKLEEYENELVKKDKKMAALFFFYRANLQLPPFMEALKQVRKSGGNVSPIFQKQLLMTAVFLIDSFAKSLEYNPNFIFAHRGLEQLIAVIQNQASAITIYNELLEKHPKHTPFITSLIFHCITVSSAQGISPQQKKELLSEAIKLGKRLIELEPEHPIAHTIMSTVYLKVKDIEKSWEEIELSNAKFKKMGRSIPLENYKMMVVCSIILQRGNDVLDVIKNAVKTYPKDGSREIASSLDSDTSWNLTLTQPDYITDEVDESEFSTYMKQFVDDIDKACTYLNGFKNTQEYIKKVRAYWAPMAALFYEPKKLRLWIDALSTKPSEDTLRMLVMASRKLTYELLLPANITLKTDYLKKINHYIKMVEPLLKEKHTETISDLKLGLVWEYILSCNKAEAGKMLNGLDPKTIAEGLYVFANKRLIPMGKNTLKNTERLLITLDLVWSRRKTFTQAINSRFIWSFEQLERQLRDHGKSKMAEEVEKKANALRQ